MKVKEAVMLLLQQDQEAELSLHTGWEGVDFMTPSGVKEYRNGYRKQSGKVVLMWYGRAPEGLEIK